jgi:hypothetical protein
MDPPTAIHGKVGSWQLDGMSLPSGEMMWTRVHAWLESLNPRALDVLTENTMRDTSLATNIGVRLPEAIRPDAVPPGAIVQEGKEGKGYAMLVDPASAEFAAIHKFLELTSAGEISTKKYDLRVWAVHSREQRKAFEEATRDTNGPGKIQT